MKIKPFNLTYFLIIIFAIITIIGITILFKNKSEKEKKKFLVIFCIYNIILFIIYKVVLALDTDFKFYFFNELPLQLCNINMFLILFGVLFNQKALKGIGFHIGVLGALIAISSPEPAFRDNSIFLFRNIGYYFTHLNIIISGILLVTLKLYEPKIKMVPKITIALAVISLFIYGFDKIMTYSVGYLVNYFFLLNSAEVGLLESFWNLIPIEYVYLIPGFIIIIALVTLEAFIFELVAKYKKRIIK